MSGAKKQKAAPRRKFIFGLTWPPNFRTVVIAGLASAAAGLLALTIILISLSRDLPSLDQLEEYKPRLITRVIGRDGAELKEFYTEHRVQVPLDSVSRAMVQAVLSTEDRRFYSHWGIDPVGIMRAMFVNTISLSKRQGASTLTQQLARNLYLHRRRTIRRKIREVITAVMIEHTYTKNEILEMYFTQMYFGHGAYGVQAAARKYFGVDASELSVPQAAMLIALLKAPATYSPIKHPEKALARRNIVLANMRREGFLSKDEYDEAVATPLEIVDNSSTDDLGTGPYFTEWVRQRLEKLQGEYGFDYYRDGLRVYTTLDSQIQALAEAAIDTHLTAFQEGFYTRFRESGLRRWLMDTYRDSLREDTTFFSVDNIIADSTGEDSVKAVLSDSLLDIHQAEIEDSVRILVRMALADSALVDSLLRADFKVQVAFVAMDPETGDVLAMVGGRDFRESKFNRAVQAKRQPGSVFKPFVYTAAIDNGIYANYRVLNMVQPVKMPDGSWWRPENYSIDDRGSYVSLRQALRHSMNNVTVRLVSGDDRVIPITEVVRYAHRMGIRTELDPVPALALGANGVIPLDVVTAYSCFASGGMRADPRSITRIEDRNGTEIVSFEPNRVSVLSPETAYIMTDLLEDVINNGTGGRARWMFRFYAPAAGKTGTTNNFTDAWFVGFTPKIVAGVWVGFDDPSKSLGLHQNGSRVALPIWAVFMRELYKAKGWKWEEFEKPVGVVRVEVCEESGQLAGPYCPTVVKEVFRRGDEPTTPCKLHRVKLGTGRGG